MARALDRVAQRTSAAQADADRGERDAQRAGMAAAAGLAALWLGSWVGLRLQRRAARRSDRRSERILEGAGEAFLEVGSDGRVRRWNTTAAKLFGWPAEMVVGRPLVTTLVDEGSHERWEEALADVPHDGSPLRRELSAHCADGRGLPVAVSMWRLPGSSGYGLFVHDLTPRKAMEEQLRRQAHHDPLTLLPNRRLLRARLSALLSEGRTGPAAVLFIDLDRFKLVNDVHGHTAGDRLLVEVAERLTAVVPPGEALVARLGGDEFAVLLPKASAAAARATADRVVAALGCPYGAAPEVAVTASVGVAAIPPRASVSAVEEVGDVLRAADPAMYAAKAAGRDRAAVYVRSMHEQLVGRVALEAELRAGLARGEAASSWPPWPRAAIPRSSAAC